MVIKSRWLLFLFVLLLVSYLREITFLSVNAYLDGETTFYAKTTEIQWIKKFDKQQLLNLKYILTFLFTGFFMLFTSIGLKLSFRNKLGYKLALLIYSLTIALVVCLVLASLFLSFNTIYPLLRELMHAIHSPILFILLSIVGYSHQSRVNQ